MSYQIIILNSITQPDNSFFITGVFWLTAPSNAIVPQPYFTSQNPNIVISDLTALKNGTIVEEGFNSGCFPAGTTLGTVQATLQAQFTAAQTTLNSVNPPLSGLIGTTYNGTSWATSTTLNPVLSVFNNGSISATGSQIVSVFNSTDVILIVNVLNAPTGTLPTLQFTIQEVDPVNQTTVVGGSASTSVINSATTSTIQITNSVSSTILVSWTLGGTGSPQFTGVNVSLIQKVSGSTMAQGAPNTLANAWPHELTDGTHGPVAVKAASTAAVATDLALVVAISPNNTITTSNLSVGATGATPPANATYIGGSVTTAAPAYTTGQMDPFSLTTAGLLRVDGVYPTGAATGADAHLVAGAVTTAPPAYTTGQMNNLSLTTTGLLRIDGSNVTQPVSGTVTANAGTGNFNIIGTGTAGTAATGVITIQGIAGGVAVPISGTVTATNPSVSTVAAAPPSSATYVGASVTTAAPTYTTGQMDPLSLTTAGLLRIDGVYPVNATTPTSDITFVGGAVTTASPAYTTGQLSSLSLTTAGALRIDGSAVTQPVSGTVTANQGTANTLANAWPHEITDGTHGPVAVKAASTAAVAADPSLVVSISPNNSVVVTQATASNLLAQVGGLGAAGSVLVGNPVQVGGSDGTDTRTFLTDASGRQIIIGAAATGAAVAGNPVLVAGSDGTDARTLATDTSGRQQMVGAAAAGAAAAGNPVQVGTVFNTTSPAPANGQIEPFQSDQAGNLLTFAGLEFIAGAAWNNATAINTLQYSTGTATAGQLTGAAAVIVQLDQTTTLTGGAVTFQGTYDNINWVTIPAGQVLNTNTFAPIANPYTFVASTNQPILLLIQGYIAIRINLTTVITGTGTVTPYWTKFTAPPIQEVTGEIEPVYGTNNQALTITLASLANAAARGCTAINNSTNLYEDVLIFVKLTTAAAGVSATGYINIYAYGSVDGGTTYSESFGGTDGAITLTSPPNATLIAQINANANATTYRAGPFSYTRMVGIDRLPQYWGVFVQNETGAAFTATAGNLAVTYQGVNGQFL